MPHRIPKHPLDTPPWGVLLNPADFGERRAILREALDDAGVELGEHDQLHSNWLASTEGTAPVTVASWIARAYDAGRRRAALSEGVLATAREFLTAASTADVSRMTDSELANSRGQLRGTLIVLLRELDPESMCRRCGEVPATERGGFCESCISRCHEASEFDHECAVCR